MQIVCDHCGETGEAASVDVVDGAVRVTCAACGRQSTMGGASERSAPPANRQRPTTLGRSAAAAGLPPVKCPKCGHRQFDENACHKCGLVFANVRGGQRPWERYSAEKQPAVRRARQLWDAVEARPSDPEVHDAFVDHCRTEQLTDFAALRYRHWVADHPDHALGQQNLERVVRDAHALASAFSRGTGEAFMRKAKTAKAVLLVVVLVLCAAALAIVLKMVSVQSSLTP